MADEFNLEDIEGMEIEHSLEIDHFLSITKEVVPLVFKNLVTKKERNWNKFIQLQGSDNKEALKQLSIVGLPLTADAMSKLQDWSGGSIEDDLKNSYLAYTKAFLLEDENVKELRNNVKNKIEEYSKQKIMAMTAVKPINKVKTEIEEYIPANAAEAASMAAAKPINKVKTKIEEYIPANAAEAASMAAAKAASMAAAKAASMTAVKPINKVKTKIEEYIPANAAEAASMAAAKAASMTAVKPINKVKTKIEEYIPANEEQVEELSKNLTEQQKTFLTNIKDFFPKVYPSYRQQFYQLLSRRIREDSYEAFVALYLLLPDDTENKNLKETIKNYVKNNFNVNNFDTLLENVRGQLGGKKKKGGAEEEETLKTLFIQYADDFFAGNDTSDTLQKIKKVVSPLPAQGMAELEAIASKESTTQRTGMSQSQVVTPISQPIREEISKPLLQQSPQLVSQPSPPQPQPQPLQLPQLPYSQQPLSQSYGKAALLTAQADLKMLLDRRAMPLTQTLPIMFSLVCLVLGIMVTIYYLISLMVMYIKMSAISSPLNNQTIDFETIKSVSLFGGKFNYTYFLILPILAIGGVILFVVSTVLFPSENPVPREIKGIVLIILLSAIIMLFTQSIMHAQLGKNIRAVSRRLKFFNRYVCSRIYKNFPFLNLLSEPKANIVSVNQTITDGLKLLTTDTPDLEMAKAFFTLTMFYHYQKIGLRNTSIFAAFDLFDPTSLLTGGCSPADYLPRYGTYIEDIGESIIRPGLTTLRLAISTEKLDQILALTSEWVTNANGYANTIYPEDAFNSFVFLTIATIIIQIIPFIILYFTYNNPERYAVTKGIHALGEALGVKFGASKAME